MDLELKRHNGEPEFPVILVTEEAYETSKSETMGSKYKFWFNHEKLGNCLYKEIRPNTGEDWAEKIGSKAAGFAQKILELNQSRLLTLRELLP